uniref:Uncharacterized protein n=1 Tax=Raphanus sativus TaxID=3726 RepID=A0A650GBQ5_RAPSA|nr:hypothetical protein [Raphanus sativus]QGW48632.1 hypothetical protein [Raphanus sativus]
MDCFFRLFRRQSAYGTSSYLVTRSSCRGTYGRIRHLGRNSFKIWNPRVFKIFNTHVSRSDTLFYSFHLYFKRDCYNIYFLDHFKTDRSKEDHCLLLSSPYESGDYWYV